MAADRLALVVFNGSTLGVGQLKTDSFISPWREARVCTAALKRSISMPYNVTALIFQFLAPNLCDARTQPPKARGTPSSRVKNDWRKRKRRRLVDPFQRAERQSCCKLLHANSREFGSCFVTKVTSWNLFFPRWSPRGRSLSRRDEMGCICY